MYRLKIGMKLQFEVQVIHADINKMGEVPSADLNEHPLYMCLNDRLRVVERILLFYTSRQ